MRHLRWVGLVSGLLFVGGLMAPLPSEADNTTVTFQVDSGNVVTLLNVASGAASTCTAGTFTGYTRCYNLINLGVLSTGTSSRSWSLGPYDATAGVDPLPRLLVTDQDSSGMDNITITTLQFDPSPIDFGSTTNNTGNGTVGNSLRYGEGHDLKVVVTNTFGITPNRRTVGTVDKYIFALRASGIFKGGGAAGATASGNSVVFEGSGRFGSDTSLTSLGSPFPANDRVGALPACDASNSRLNPPVLVNGVSTARTPSSDVNYCTLRRTFGTTAAPTSSYSNVTPTPPLEQVTNNGSPYPSYTCDNGTNCTPTVTLKLTARVNGPDTWVLTSSGDAAGGTKHRCSNTDDDNDDHHYATQDADDSEQVCLSTKKRVKRYFRQQLKRDLADPNFVAAESTIACGGEGNPCPITTTTGTITINKEISDSIGGGCGGNCDGTFEFSISGPTSTIVSVRANNFGTVVVPVDAGDYTVSETSPPTWYLDSSDCDGNSPVEGFAVPAGGNVTCTFVNAVSIVIP